jgi:hypothetical protein
MCWLGKGVLADGQRNRVFQMRPNRQGGGQRLRQPQRQGRKATRAAQDHFAPGHHAYDRIVYVTCNWPVVDEEDIGDAA